MNRKICALMFATFAPSAFAQNVEVLDLAEGGGTRNVDAGESFRLLIRNRLPQFDYRVSKRAEVLAIPELTLPDELATRSGNTFCDIVENAVDDTLNALDNEDAIPAAMAGLRTRASQCDDDAKARLESAILNTVYLDEGEVVVESGQEFVVNVSRPGRSWEYRLSAGARGEWRTFYGFNFFPNQDEKYVSRQDNINPGEYVVTRQSDDAELDFAPSVFFTWMPSSRLGKSWAHGFGAGLGFDLDNPIVFGGYAATFNENIMLTTGMVFHKQSRLSGRYFEGQTILENLDDEQLSQQTFDANFYIGVGFRFGASPFGGSE